MMKETVEVDRSRLRVMLAVAALEGRDTEDAPYSIAADLLGQEEERDARRILRQSP